MKKRNPLGTRDKDHQSADSWFLKKFGIRFRSDHIMFASSDTGNLGFYGKIHKVIPIKEFQFCWSPAVFDFTEFRDEYFDTDMDELLDVAEYRTNNLENAMLSGNEIMIQCKQYFLLDVTDEEYTQIIKIAKGMK